MKRWIVLIVAAALGYAVFWFYEANALRGQVSDWMDARRADGWQVEAEVKVRGFPSRLDLTLSDLDVITAEGTRVEAPIFQSLGLTYKPGHHILVLPQGAVITKGGATTTVDGQGLRASVITDADGQLLRLNAEAETLNIANDDRSLAAAGVLLGFQMASARTYRLGLSADALAGPSGTMAPDSADALSVQAEIAFDRDWRLGDLPQERPQPTNLDLRLAQYQVGALNVHLAGKMSISASGTPDGALTLRATNWQEALTGLRDTGHLPDTLADALMSGLSLAATLSGKPNTLDLPLTFKGGKTNLGPIPLGPAPRLRLP
ncbi:DUF2125 domain-containing protein [Tropicibacter naphthalenivorans]|uniref:DUF2125 domain-containing protein n=1 Tax=Tropicibacter naphthalenivorans TaxID=441103 RepID=A0A0P1G0M0_9RHOB|nr:DUF2125 domain-containing protein [Tropicibacter naphthalenivorans]CUH75030.1 hypothetical protein TRN7648_00217 [Tropicibacter naphthalenivorans]SMC47243.1 hypothetical protein SAMN04488093_101663 [Tropicibacter naphthalenivorans]